MITMSCRIAGGDYDCRGVTTRMLKVHLTRIGVEAQALRRAMIAAYEAEMNVVIHARTGSMWARFDDGRLDLEVTDEGPGIRDDEAASDRLAAGAVAADGAVLVIPSGFLSGFPGGAGPDRVLGALARLGFMDVRLTEDWEGALRAASCDAAGASPRHLPVIPPVCPAVVSLIEMQFPSLLPNLAPYLSLVAACPSQYAAAIRSSHTERLTVASPARLAREILPLIGSAKGGTRQPEINGEGSAEGDPGAEGAPGAELRVTGMCRVQKILSEVETGALEGVSVLECFACEQGCVGSPSCTAFAEDVVMGRASESACPYPRKTEEQT